MNAYFQIINKGQGYSDGNFSNQGHIQSTTTNVNFIGFANSGSFYTGSGYIVYNIFDNSGDIKINQGGSFDIYQVYPGCSWISDSFSNSGSIEISGGGSVTITNLSQVANSGIIDVGAGSALIIEQLGGTTWSGNGVITLENGAGLELRAGIFASNLLFASGAVATLKVDGSATFDGTISGLAQGDVIDFTHQAVTGITTNSDTSLTVTLAGGATDILTLATPLPTGEAFYLATDGNGGAELVVKKTHADTAANLEALTPTDIAALEGTGVQLLVSTDAPLSFSAAQAQAIAAATLDISAPSGDSVTIADSGAQLSTLTVSNWTALIAGGVTAVTDTDSGAITLSASVVQTINDVSAIRSLLGTFSIAVHDTAANVAAALDTLNGSADVQSITLTDGGTPTLAMTYTQYTSDSTALGKITGPYRIDVVGVNGQAMTANASGIELDGSAGNEVLTASAAGGNILAGGADDTLNGSIAGGDQFVFHAGFGMETVNNFATGGANHDVLQFDKAVFADWAHLLGAAKQSGSDLVITFDANDIVTLKNVSLANFASTSATFV